MDRDELRRIALHGWGAVADRYAEELFGELDRKQYDRELLALFASKVTTDLPVLDLGCGPGHVSAHLAKLGIMMHGIDLAPDMIRVARELNPDLSFEVGDMLDLRLAPQSIGGVILMYSIINLTRSDVPLLFQQLARGMAPGAPLLVGTHSGNGEIREDEIFGEKVEMVATLFTAEELSSYAVQAGLTVEVADTRMPYLEEYQSRRAYLLARAT